MRDRLKPGWNSCVAHPPVTGVNVDHSRANLSCSIEGEVKKKYVSDRWSLSCFQPHLLEQGRF